MPTIAVIIAAVFIALYFYRSANSIGKNGALWVGIALGTFVVVSVLAGLVLYFLFVSALGYDSTGSSLWAGFLGLGGGLVGLLVVNYYLNIIPD